MCAPVCVFVSVVSVSCRGMASCSLVVISCVWVALDPDTWCVDGECGCLMISWGM